MDPRFNAIFSTPDNEDLQGRLLSRTGSTTRRTSTPRGAPVTGYNVLEVRGRADFQVLKAEV